MKLQLKLLTFIFSDRILSLAVHVLISLQFGLQFSNELTQVAVVFFVTGTAAGLSNILQLTTLSGALSDQPKLQVCYVAQKEKAKRNDVSALVPWYYIPYLRSLVGI